MEEGQEFCFSIGCFTSVINLTTVLKWFESKIEEEEGRRVDGGEERKMKRETRVNFFFKKI